MTLRQIVRRYLQHLLALVAMVGRLTVGRKKYAAVHEEMGDAIADAEALRAELTALMRADSAAFERVLVAVRLPQASPAVIADLAPTGKMRVGLNMSNFLLTRTDAATGTPAGVAPDLAQELGRRLGVPVELIPYPNPGLWPMRVTSRGGRRCRGSIAASNVSCRQRVACGRVGLGRCA